MANELSDLPLSRQEISEIKADLDAGRMPWLVWIGYPTDVILMTMLFYELEDRYTDGKLTWPQFAHGVLGTTQAF